MKNLKAKLMASVASLLVATLAMTSASFAWFTISTHPEITNMESSATANGNLEIALASSLTQTTVSDSAVGDAGSNTKWGNLVDLTSVLDDDIVLKPVQLGTDGTVKAPKFGLDGRISELATLTGTWASATESPSDDTDFDDGGYVAYKYAGGSSDENDATVWAYRVDFFMRTNTAGKISLSTAADRGAGDESGAGSTLTCDNPNVKVAFQVDGGSIISVTNTNGVLTADIIDSATVDKVYKVSMYVYLDGTSVTNANLDNTATSVTLNIQFKHSATLNPIEIKGANYDKIADEDEDD